MTSLKYKLNLLVFLICMSFNCLAQEEAAIWYFGYNAGLDFSSGAPVAILDGQLNTIEGCATISDPSGSLLFYTDGITVWDKNHDVMPNGIGLLGDPSSTQSGIIVPKPNNSDIYYVFTVDDSAGPNGLNYSEVDMTLNGGNGDVTALKNIQLATPTTEKITAIEHDNGTDFWVVTHEFNSNNFAAYLVTQTGVTITPVISSVGSIHDGETLESFGYMKISPNGERLALAKYTSIVDVELFDFDNATGIVSNPLELQGVFYDNGNGSGTYGIEFSPNNQLLYVSDVDFDNTTSRVHQFDISQNSVVDILNSDTIIYEGNNLIGAIQLAIDQKMYVSVAGSFLIDVIENPNSMGISANYNSQSVNLGGRTAAFGLPPFIQSFFNVGIDVNGICLGESTQFSVSASDEIVSISWDFGDGNSSDDENPSHTYTAAGEYDVVVNVSSVSNTTTLSRTIKIYDLPIANPINDYVVCDDVSNDGINVFDLTTKLIEIYDGQSDTVFDVAFYSSLEDAQNDNNPLPLNYPNSSTPELIFAKIFNTQNDICNDITNFQLIVNPSPIANPIDDFRICDDEIEDGLELVDLSQFNASILNGQSEDVFEITYHLNQNDADNNLDALSTPYQTVSNPQNLVVRIENRNDNTCYDTTEFNIIVDGQLIAFQPDNLYTCDDLSYDGFEIFNLLSLNDQISNGQTGSFNITYHTSEEFASEGTNQLSSNYQNISNPEILFARIENANNRNCYDITSFEISTFPLPSIVDEEAYVLCVGDSIELEAEEGYDYYNWSTSETTRTITVNEAGIYTVEIIDENQVVPSFSCSRTKTFVITASDVATISIIQIEDWSQNNNIISVFMDGLGDYEFSLDNITYQDSHIFSGLSPDAYTVYVRDKNDCGIVTENVFILYYPKFFTPNGDVYNQTWQIINGSSELDLEVLIFDRYGKLIAEFSSQSAGWDGTYNGQDMPATDYWFVVKRPSIGKTYRGHFTLRR